MREWAGRVFLAAFLLGVFVHLSASPVVRPGGVIATLPAALLTALAVAVPVTLIVGGALAHYSDRKGRFRG
ncbi:MAG: hypothetical protein HKM95_09195 [Inquilinus sp.]|nr:hypothetical protein [Inquilinus sp.]